MMYTREISSYIKKSVEKYAVITLFGPRQSGKSTLGRALFPDYSYLSLESLDLRELALKDPKGFLNLHSGNLIIDEVQRAPDILSYLQTIVDEPQNARRFILTGSQNLLLMQNVSQTLAGRTAIAHLLPFSRREIAPHHPDQTLEEYLFTGGYPRIYDKNIEPQDWLAQYYQTYVERDVRQLTQVGDLRSFQTFVSLCAARAGSLINFSDLARDANVSPPTAKAWLSVLETGFVCLTLKPHFKNFSKRLIKSPKIYFYDTGLLCYLLRVKSADELKLHPMRGAIFENWVISERLKSCYNQGLQPAYYFWRDVQNHEVDLIRDDGTRLFPIEIKSNQTFREEFLQQINYLEKLQKTPAGNPRGECIYAGDKSFAFDNYRITSWKDV